MTVAVRIQRTPEKVTNNTGEAGTWVVFTVALVVLLGLMLVPALTTLRRSEAIYQDIRRSQEQFQQTQRILATVAQHIYTLSVTIRDFLLDNAPDAGRQYRARLGNTREQLQQELDRVRGMLPAAHRLTLQQLQHEVDAYLTVITSIFDWLPPQRVDRGAYFLREEQRPRRESILAVAQQLAQINQATYAEQQQRTTESEMRFRADLVRSAVLAFVAGLVVSGAGIVRMRSLERRAHAEQGRAEQTGEELRQLSARLRHVQEEERRSISRELHDDVGQKLTAMRLELGALDRLHGSDREQHTRAVSGLKALSEQSLRSIRELATGLRPSVIDDLGLDAAVHRLTREFSKGTGIASTLTVDGTFADFDDRRRIYVYRIVQEALTNCAKHAHATDVHIVLRAVGNGLRLSITDNGQGFQHSPALHAGLGLIGIDERVRELGGEVHVRSGDGQGTAIEISIPRGMA